MASAAFETAAPSVMSFFAFARDSVVPTFFGWTPGLRALVGGRILPCGCMTGAYHTWRGATVVILDVPARSCRHAHHRRNVVLWRGAGAREVAPFEELSSSADFA